MMSKLNRRLSLYLQSLRFTVALPHMSGRVLDVGCNTGTLLERAHRVESYVGVDVDPECVRSIEEKRPGVEVYCADVQRESLPVTEPFDTLVALAVIEHLSSPRDFLKRYVPALKMGSTIVLTTPTPLGEQVHRMLQKIHLTAAACSELHQKIYRMPELEEMLKSHGFDIIEARRFELGMNQLVAGRRVREVEGLAVPRYS